MDMNGYICFYKSRKVEVYATTTHNAQLKAAQLLGAKRSYDVSVVLAEKNGQQVTHSTAGI